MNLLSKVSYFRIRWIATRIELRNTLNDFGICSDYKTRTKDEKDVLKVACLVQKLTKEDKEKLSGYHSVR